MPRIPLSALALLALSACSATGAPAQPAPVVSEAPVSGYVSDLAAFQAYLAGKPTPAQFKAHYPDVTLVLPGQIATKEFRLNHSRYFAELDAEGRIVGGKFQ